MSLANMIWRPTTVHEVVAEFLRAERHKLTGASPEVTMLIDNPDITNPRENHARLRCLYLIRGKLWAEIPPDTEWYEVNCLSEVALNCLHVIARCGWDEPNSNDKNELLSVAVRKPNVLRSTPENWRRPILWGHGREGPFTIIEGNTRLTAYASASIKPKLAIPVFVGLSITPCFWHIHDPARIIANDLWK